jgi:hypothetical protein
MMLNSCSFMTDFRETCKANVAVHPNVQTRTGNYEISQAFGGRHGRALLLIPDLAVPCPDALP